MLKKVLPIVFLVGLVVWGVFDYSQSHQKSEMSASSSSNREVGIEKGNIAPDFTLKNLQGEPVKLSDFRGKNVIINFWATWCPPCRVEMPHMQAYYESHKKDDFVILAVNMTASEKSKKDVKQFVNDYGLTFPVVLDVKGEVTNTYQVMAYPTSYFVDKHGVIQYKVMGAMNQNTIKKIMGKMK